jgi:hypothetical protein
MDSQLAVAHSRHSFRRIYITRAILPSDDNRGRRRLVGERLAHV